MTHMHHHRFTNSVKYACRGLSVAWREQNFRIQAACCALVLGAAAFFRVARTELLFLLLASLLVLVLELVNTIFEQFTDFFSPRYSEMARAVKDLMAAAVLVASVGAVAIGAVIFGPYVVELF